VDPKKLKKWLIIIAAVYLVFPRDLFPDYIGRGLGFIDDVLLIGVLRHFYRQRLLAYAAKAAGGGEWQESRDQSGPARPAAEAAPNAWAILGVAASATDAEITSAYKARMSEYHPDKVAHLGEDLQKLAHQKTLEIQDAYRQLRR